MADNQKARLVKRAIFNFKLERILDKPRAEEVNEGFIYYRWYYSDDSQDFRIEQIKQGLVQDYSQRIEGAHLIETKPNLNLTKAISL